MSKRRRTVDVRRAGLNEAACGGRPTLSLVSHDRACRAGIAREQTDLATSMLRSELKCMRPRLRYVHGFSTLIPHSYEQARWHYQCVPAGQGGDPSAQLPGSPLIWSTVATRLTEASAIGANRFSTPRGAALAHQAAHRQRCRPSPTVPHHFSGPFWAIMPPHRRGMRLLECKPRPSGRASRP